MADSNTNDLANNQAVLKVNKGLLKFINALMIITVLILGGMFFLPNLSNVPLWFRIIFPLTLFGVASVFVRSNIIKMNNSVILQGGYFTVVNKGKSRQYSLNEVKDIDCRFDFKLAGSGDLFIDALELVSPSQEGKGTITICSLKGDSEIIEFPYITKSDIESFVNQCSHLVELKPVIQSAEKGLHPHILWFFKFDKNKSKKLL